MRRLLSNFVFLPPVIAVIAAPATAEPDPTGLPAGLSPGETARVVSVIDGDTVALESGREVRLVGIQAPKLPLGRRGFRPWPLAKTAKAALERLAKGRRVRLHYGGRRTDRHRRRLAHLQDLETGRWVQGQLLADGMARVYTFRDNRAAASEMLALERRARTTRRGIWALRHYRSRTPEEVRRDIGSFQVVEGPIVDVAVRRGKIFVNFGADWRTDFTVVLRGRNRRLFARAGLDPTAWKGRRIRVRGWVSSYNGPMVEATHPEQIELLGPK